MHRLAGLIVLGFLLTTGAARAADAPHAGPAHHADDATGPVLSSDDRWVRKVLVGVAAVFAMAVMIGPAYRAHLPEEIPLTHSHDEPPGASGLHGRSGAIDPTAPDGALH